jgi:hypothetical protein
MAKKSEAKKTNDAVVTEPQDDSAVVDAKKPAAKVKKEAVPDEVKAPVKEKKQEKPSTPKDTPKKKQPSEKAHAEKDEAVTLESFGPVCKAFILENIRIIEYRDLAKLMGIKPDDLKKAVEAAGIRLPIERAMRWSDIDVGTYRSLMDCARCQVQLNHGTFFVGLKNCRKCIEQNIAHWIENGVTINLRF